MNKEPIGLYIFRYVSGFTLLALMGMIYWSSLLLEEDLKDLHDDLKEIQSELVEVKEESQRTREELFRSLLTVGQLPRIAQQERAQTATPSDYPNLLEKDPFYESTLPALVGDDFRPYGTFRTATIGRPHNLHPLSNWSSVSGWTSQCRVTVAASKFGRFETMAPDMAHRIELRPAAGRTDEQEFWVFLRDGVYWQPLEKDHFPEDIELDAWFLRKHQVTSHDFKFAVDAIMNPHVEESGAASLRNYLQDIEEFRIIDDLTFVMRWKHETVEREDGSTERKMKYSAKGLTGRLQPLPTWVYRYFPDGSKIVEEDSGQDAYRTNSVWAQNFGQHWARNVIVSCGAWIFDGMTDKAIKFRRNPDHYRPLAALTQAQIVYFKETPEAVWQDFKAGDIDVYSIRPDQLIELEDFMASEEYRDQMRQGAEIHRLDYVARSYNYLGWNQSTPWFKSANVRRAMTMMIDRERIIDQYLNRMGIQISGPFFVHSPSYDKDIVPYPYNRQEAIRLLEEDGWYDSDGDGIRDKEIDGRRVPFRFSLTYFVKNPSSKQNSEYVATTLKEIGIDCQLNGVDIADLSSTWDEKSFDVIYLGWALGAPPEEPRQLWHSSQASEKGSSNAVGFVNTEADKLIDSLQYEYDLKRREEMYHRFHSIIHEQAPYTFLYTPKVAFLYRDRVQNVFIPADRQDLIPGANWGSPASGIFTLRPSDSREQ